MLVFVVIVLDLAPVQDESRGEVGVMEFLIGGIRPSEFRKLKPSCRIINRPPK